MISAYYDNELTESELDLLLEETKRDPNLLAKLNNYALISAISEKDESFEDNGMKIVVDKKSLFYLLGTELDFSDGLNGKGLFSIMSL